MPQEQTLSLFNQYGLAGVVIGALFVSLWLLIKEIKAMNEIHDKRVDAQAALHKDERNLWFEAYQDNIEVLRKLTANLETLEADKKV